jgi:hypothetical protein
VASVSVGHHVPSTFLGNADLHAGDSQGKRTPVCAYSQMRRRNRVRQIEPNAQPPALASSYSPSLSDKKGKRLNQHQ